MIVVIIAGAFCLGLGTGAFAISLFAARAYDKGELNGYEQGRREGFMLGRGEVR